MTRTAPWRTTGSTGGRALSDFDLDTFLPYRLSVAASRVSRGFAARYRNRFGITPAEWRVLAHLAHAGPVSVREIASRADLEKSRVSRAAARLESAGYLAKTTDTADRRLVALALTSAGRGLVAEIAALARACHSELMARLGPEAETVATALDRLAESAGAPQD